MTKGAKESKKEKAPKTETEEKKKKYYVLCLSESIRCDVAFESKEEILTCLEKHIKEHNNLIDDPALQFEIEDFAIVEDI